MYGITELKKDVLITQAGVPYRVIESTHTQLGRGGAVVRAKLKNLLDGTVVTRTFKGNDKVESAQVDRVPLQYLYAEPAAVIFMDTQSYDQLPVAKSLVADQLAYLPEGAIATGLRFQGRIVGLELPVKVELKVTQSEPGVRGDTSGTALKPATLETGFVIKVPLFIKPGDLIRVDTRDGSYVERV
ncbi:elongation factor P [Candidatus Microgenomates bacterium]|nr:elongation factor P [Candidatus Microgenomates bacterium]